MTTEEKIFARKRFVREKAERFGFRKSGDGYGYEADFFNGDFRALLTVKDGGIITGRVIDKMNGEDYAPLRIESFGGAYVNSVRTAYEELLCEIAENCCEDVLFACDQANRIAARIFELYSVKPDYPWEQRGDGTSGVFRHLDSGKWFALIMNVRRGVLPREGGKDTVDIINLKVDPGLSATLCKKPGIYPAYHMNHKSWISVTLDDRQSDAVLEELTEQSFILTGKPESNRYKEAVEK